jgi:hypothetical protein
MLLAGLGVGAVGAAAAAAPMLTLRLAGDSARPASWWERSFTSLQAAGLAEWTGAIGETFTLGTNTLKVVAVTAFPKSGSRPSTLGRSQAFSVAFESIAGPPLPATDRMYQLVHPSYPPLPIYMGAPAQVAQKSRLIAVFN